MICEGLGKCLEEKPFNKITVNDVYEKSFVSRATFYRLFDNLSDVLSYECDTLFAERLKLIENRTFSDKKEQALYCIRIWLSHTSLVKAIVDNNLYRILYDTHAKNADLLKKNIRSRFPSRNKPIILFRYSLLLYARRCPSILNTAHRSPSKKSTKSFATARASLPKASIIDDSPT